MDLNIQFFYPLKKSGYNAMLMEIEYYCLIISKTHIKKIPPPFSFFLFT